MTLPVGKLIRDTDLCDGSLGCGCKPPPKPKVFVHGIRSSYVAGCHCPRCTEADRRYKALWRDERAQKLMEKKEAEAKLAKKLYDQERYKQRKAGTWKA